MFVRTTDLDDAGMPRTATRTSTTQPVEPLGLAWSRDGASIVYTSGPSVPCGSGGSGSTQAARPNASRWPVKRRIPGNCRDARPAGVLTGHVGFASLSFIAGQPAEEVASSSSHETDHFSPDGRRLAFASGRSGKTQIWVAAADGSNPRQLTNNVRHWPGSPSWSPDGRSIAFDSGEFDGQTRIWIIDADGGTARPITKDRETSRCPVVPRRQMDLLLERRRRVARDLARGPDRGKAGTDRRGRAAASSDTSSATAPASCTSRFMAIRRCY